MTILKNEKQTNIFVNFLFKKKKKIHTHTQPQTHIHTNKQIK